LGILDYRPPIQFLARLGGPSSNRYGARIAGKMVEKKTIFAAPDLGD
jgi:hypothetical protein